MTSLQLSSIGLQINTVAIQFPVSISALKRVLDHDFRAFKTKNNTIYTWDDLGITCYSKNGILAESLTANFKPDGYNFSPTNHFNGQFEYHNHDIIEYYKTNKKECVKLFEGDDGGALVSNTISAWFDADEQGVNAIEVSTFKPYDKSEGIPEDKYTIRPLEEAIIPFEDFGFKLSVIEELMYNKGLLKPKFDIYEFAKWYKKRDINIDEEGYNQIPEVEQYFKDLPIPKRLAPALTEIYQDGGNDIYMNLAPFSGGAVDCWDIKTSEDVKHFNNLKKATLCYATDTAYDEMIASGIDAEWL